MDPDQRGAAGATVVRRIRPLQGMGPLTYQLRVWDTTLARDIQHEDEVGYSQILKQLRRGSGGTYGAVEP